MKFAQEKKFKKMIQNAKRIAILSHIDCDYDSLCSSFALQSMLVNAGKLANVYFDAPPPTRFEYIMEGKTYLLPDEQKYDLSIVFDLANIKRLGSSAGVFKNCTNSINVDHHPEESNFTDLTIRAPDISSTCEILYWLTRKHFKYDSEVAKLLYIGISGDTGGFVFANTGSNTFKCLADLYTFNNKYDEIARDAFNHKSKEQIQLFRMGLESVQYFDEGRISVSFLPEKAFKDTGTMREDASFLVMLLQQVEGVLVSVNICEDKPKDYRISLRAAHSGIDVSVIAGAFGGGGHMRASGCGAKGEFVKVRDKIVALAKKAIAERGD